MTQMEDRNFGGRQSLRVMMLPFFLYSKMSIVGFALDLVIDFHEKKIAVGFKIQHYTLRRNN
jgi:hypothetical protein